MSKRKIVEKLAEIFEVVTIHPEAVVEIRDLIIGSGHEAEFIKLFAQRTKQMCELGREVIKLNCFEKLSDVEDLYSMKFASTNFNLRILYSYQINEEILLTCFYERAGKNRTSYKMYIPVAIRRQKEMGGKNDD